MSTGKLNTGGASENGIRPDDFFIQCLQKHELTE